MPVIKDVSGPTKLDFFAGCVLSGITAGTLSRSVSGGDTTVIDVHVDWDQICEKSYEVAHVMMKHREAS